MIQVILWIGEGSMQTVDILYDIDEYLNGLDNIVMDNEVGEKMCETPNYGHFVVVINKMMGDATDEHNISVRTQCDIPLYCSS